MAKRYSIPRLVPNGIRADVLTHAPSRKRTGCKSDKERLESEPWSRLITSQNVTAPKPFEP